MQCLTAASLLFVSQRSSHDKSSCRSESLTKKMPLYSLPLDMFVLKFLNGSRIRSVAMAMIIKELITQKKKWYRMTFDLFLFFCFQPWSSQLTYQKGGCCPLLMLQKTELVFIFPVLFLVEKRHENFTILHFSSIACKSLQTKFLRPSSKFSQSKSEQNPSFQHLWIEDVWGMYPKIKGINSRPSWGQETRNNYCFQPWCWFSAPGTLYWPIKSSLETLWTYRLQASCSTEH